jgi:hypothetical protein
VKNFGSIGKNNGLACAINMTKFTTYNHIAKMTLLLLDGSP